MGAARRRARASARRAPPASHPGARGKLHPDRGAWAARRPLRGRRLDGHRGDARQRRGADRGHAGRRHRVGRRAALRRDACRRAQGGHALPPARSIPATGHHPVPGAERNGQGDRRDPRPGAGVQPVRDRRRRCGNPASAAEHRRRDRSSGAALADACRPAGALRAARRAVGHRVGRRQLRPHRGATPQHRALGRERRTARHRRRGGLAGAYGRLRRDAPGRWVDGSGRRRAGGARVMVRRRSDGGRIGHRIDRNAARRRAWPDPGR